jgi:DNA topoisomerase-6 subunit B
MSKAKKSAAAEASERGEAKPAKGGGKRPKAEAMPDLGADAAKEVIDKVRKSARQITASSTAEYFSKNLQQVGFSSPTKAVLTTLKEALDNSLDACEDAGILPDIKVTIQKKGPGTLKNTDQLLIRVEDNGPGIDPDDVAKVFGEYLASSKFGRGRCSRGQQGIGISAATTWAMQTTARGARVETKKASAKKAFSCVVDMDLKNNRGILRDKETIEWKRPHGTTVEFSLDGRVQLQGEGGVLAYLRATSLVNPHLTLTYSIPETPKAVVERVTSTLPVVPEATEPHPHTMKLGEFMAHGRLFGRIKTGSWLKRGFSRVSEKTLEELRATKKVPPGILDRNIESLSETDFKLLFAAIQDLKLLAPSTGSVLAIGEEGLALSIRRLGDIDFFAVLSRKPTICDFKPVQVEVAIARLRQRGGEDNEEPVQVLRFANRVPLQFDKAACAIVKAINSVTWRSYGIRQPKDSLPLGPYIVAVSVVSPFIKFKNASKETVDASDELVEELRRALMQTGQRLSRYLKREHKADELEQRAQHIEQFGPILVETLARILKAPDERKRAAEAGLAKLLEKDTKGIKKDLAAADERLASYLEEKKKKFAHVFAGLDAEEAAALEAEEEAAAEADADGDGDGESEGDEAPKGKGAKGKGGKAGGDAKAAKAPKAKKKSKQKKESLTDG